MLNLLFLAWVVLALSLGGCGGGGGSSDVDGIGESDTDTDVPSVETTEPEVNPIQPQPNILLIISDDQGLDASAQYDLSDDLPATPTLDALATSGLVFENVWATPGCTTTRSSMITGKYGVNTGVVSIGDELPADETILHAYLVENTATAGYQSAVIGKWHLAGQNSPSITHPNDMGVDYYAGLLRGGLTDYSDWPLVENGESTQSFEYNTTKLTNLAIEWISTQSTPWFLWLAYVAPHDPFHLPPADLHTLSLTGTDSDISANPRDYYLASIEAMDTEIGRLLASMSEEERDNTIILYIGDNGSPTRVVDQNVYANGAKASLTEGGLRVPMVISGAGVSRKGERETALINSTDFFASIIELAGSSNTAIHNSISFVDLLSDSDAEQRQYVYAGFESENVSGWAIRNARYKLIETTDGLRQLYDLIDNPDENIDLLNNGADFSAVVAELSGEAASLRQPEENGGGSLSDDPIDITDAIFTNLSANCADYVNSYESSARDVLNDSLFAGNVVFTIAGDKCVLETNGIPNHDFNDGSRSFANDVSVQNQYFEIPSNPQVATQTTPLTIGVDTGIMLNGVKVDLLAAACFGVGDERTGCLDAAQPWRFDPMFAANGFAVDTHNAHAQPNGAYHYHASPNAMFFTGTNIESPVVGFAADGFPIVGSWFDDSGTVRKATPSYRLKSGRRASGTSDPGGEYDGSYRDDYEYVTGLGDLDECNGMTVDGVYGYYVTDSFPYIVGCFKGTVDSTFN